MPEELRRPALAALAAAGVARAPLAAWEALRVELGLPRWGRELTDDVIAEEAGLLGSHVHLEKGCYPGQETVARVHNLGQVRSVALHPELGPIGLAFVRQVAPSGSKVLAGESAALVVELPFHPDRPHN